MSRTRASRQRKVQGYYTTLGGKQPIQGPAHPYKAKWAELELLRIIAMQTITALISLMVFAIVDVLAGTHLFGIPAFIGVAAYATGRIFYKKRNL